MRQHLLCPAPVIRRRSVLAALLAAPAALAGAAEQPVRIWRIAFANLTDEAGQRIEGLGFTGPEVRRSFELAARTLPVEMSYYDNAQNPAKALANAEAAVRARVDLLIEYNADAAANAEIAGKLRTAGIPIIAINHPVAGAPLYAMDNRAAGRIAGGALAEFAQATWPNETTLAVIIGDFGDTSIGMAERVAGITDGLRKHVADLVPTKLDTSGNPIRVEALLVKFLRAQPRRKVVVAALDDATALAARGAIELASRTGDCVIVGQGVDRSIHGGASDRKELDPSNRGSIVLGSVAYYMDRYGYDVLPLALDLLRGKAIPGRTATQHKLITAKDIFREYPPFDMN